MANRFRLISLGLAALSLCIATQITIAAALTVTNLTDTTASGSLRAAIIAANETSGSTITFQGGLSGTITLTSSLPLITANVTIDGPGQSIIAIDGAGLYRQININAATDVISVAGLTLAHGSDQADSAGGGALNLSAGTVTVANCTIQGNSATYGGGINQGVNTSLFISNCAISANTASINGGGIFAKSAVITNCTITGNKAINGSSGGDGAGMYNQGTSTLEGCTLSDNIGHGNGGGIGNYGNLALTNCTLSANSAASTSANTGSGGGLYSYTGTVTLTNCILLGNTASTDGGGINGGSTLTNCTLSDNTSNRNGGGVLNNGTTIISGCTLTQNGTGSQGGGVYNASSGTISLRNCTLLGNSSNTYGGGQFPGYGGGIFNEGSESLFNCTLSGNSSAVNVGAIYNNHGTTALTNCIAYGDTGGELFAFSGVLTVTFSDIAGDYAGTGNISANPLITSLANNGGATETMALISGSPCYGAGTPTGAPATDQRGVARPNPPSMGAYDSGVITPLNTFNSGLQMISAPVDDSAYSLTQIFNESAVLAVWTPESDTYAVSPTYPADTLRPGQGYWVRFTSSTNLLDVGTPVNPDTVFTIQLAQGWNMIGCPFGTLTAIASLSIINSSNVVESFGTAATGGLVGSALYTYQQGDTAYEIIPDGSGSLTPYVGYWLYASLPCTLQVPAPGGPPPPPT